MMREQIFYVTMPYRHKDPNVVRSRMAYFYDMDGIFVAHQMHTISALSKHPIITRSQFPSSWKYWENHPIKLLSISTFMLILATEGWLECNLIDKQAEYCDNHNIPYLLLSESDIRSGRFWTMINEKLK